MNLVSFGWMGSVALLVAVATGCTTVNTKTVLFDGEAYMASSFTPAQLKPSVRSLIENGEVFSKLFERINYTVTTDINEEGKTTQVTSKNVFVNLGNGYFQHKAEYSSNGVPYRVNIALTYAGVYKLKTQTTFINRTHALSPLETKEITRFDRGLGKPQPGQSYFVDAKTGSEQQIINNFWDENMSCIANTSIPATTMHSSLLGSGVPIECNLIGKNGTITGRSKFLWVAELGVAFLIESANARSISRHKIESISIIK